MALAAAASISLSGCQDRPPAGQVVAEIDGTDVTRREVRFEMNQAGANNDTADEAADTVLSDTLETIVDRKILAQVAHDQGLEQDSSYHFGLRQARERLLVDALQRDLLEKATDPGPVKIAEYIRARPWQFKNRRIVTLRSLQEGAPEQQYNIDTAQFDTRPSIYLNADSGSRIRFGGRDWTIVRTIPAPLDERQSTDWARRSIVADRVEAQMNAIVIQARQKGKIRYQVGFGPSSE